jgi:hypothetical protein
MKTHMTVGDSIPYWRVAEACGLEPWALQRLEQSRFRSSPEFFREVGGSPYLTIKGVREMARVLKAHGYPSKEHALNVLANQRENTPARELITAAAKNQPVVYPWMQRKDCA